MLTSFIVLVLVLVAGVFLSGGQPPWKLQPATAVSGNRSGVTRRSLPGLTLALRFEEDDTDDTSIILDSLRALGLVRRGIERPVVGQKAYVRVWERIRAAIVLTAIIVTIGVLLAASIGVLVLAAGYLLEQAIA